MAPDQRKQQKKDSGLVHILHKAIRFLADGNNHVKTYAQPIFTLGRLSKGMSKATSKDGEQRKQNMGYVIHQSK